MAKDKITRRWEKQQDRRAMESAQIKAWLDKILGR